MSNFAQGTSKKVVLAKKIACCRKPVWTYFSIHSKLIASEPRDTLPLNGQSYAQHSLFSLNVWIVKINYHVFVLSRAKAAEEATRGAEERPEVKVTTESFVKKLTSPPAASPAPSPSAPKGQDWYPLWHFIEADDILVGKLNTFHLGSVNTTTKQK